METILTFFSIIGAAIWLVILLLPWRPWSMREALDAFIDMGKINNEYSQENVHNKDICIRYGGRNCPERPSGCWKNNKKNAVNTDKTANNQ